MSIYIISKENGHKVAHAVKTEAEFRSLRSSEANLKNLEEARKGNKSAKGRLVQFNYSGMFVEGGAIKNVTLPSNKFVLDIDDPAEYSRVRRMLINDPMRYNVLMLERSVGQGGHIVARREKGKTILESQIALARELKCEVDTNNHAINGVFYGTSADLTDLEYVHPDLFADDYSMEEAEAEAEVLKSRCENREEAVPDDARGQKHYKPWKTSSVKESDESLSVPYNNNESVSCEAGDDQLEYKGIPYTKIISKWWELYNNGETPVKSNRNSLTYELAVNLRHICSFDRSVMAKVIPCYDGFPEAEKMKCIDSALSTKMTMMPKRLREVMMSLRAENSNNEQFAQAMDELVERDEVYYYDALGKGSLPMGISDSINAVGPELTMPVILTTAPIIGVLATGVKVTLRKKDHRLNIWSFIAGKSGSGKGSMDDIVKAWAYKLIEEEQAAHEKEKEWRKKKERLGNSQKEQPERPDLPVRYITLNNTMPNIATRLENVKGKHCYSYTPEVDTCLNKWRGSVGEYSAMGRQAWDGSAYARDARGAEAASVSIPELLWNVTTCGTPDALYRIVTNYTDGLLSRLAIARTPDNTFSPLSEKTYVMTAKQREHIQQIASLLPLLQGTVSLPKLEENAQLWVENVRLEAIKNNDEVYADSRKRNWVTAFRITVCLMLCRLCGMLIKKFGYEKAKEMLEQDPELWKRKIRSCQTKDMLNAYNIIADSLIDNDMYFFREKLETAYNSKTYGGNERQRHGKNDSIYARLDNTFGFDQAMQQTIVVRGETVNRNTIICMLRNWVNQGLCVRNDDGTYTKNHLI